MEFPDIISKALLKQHFRRKITSQLTNSSHNEMHFFSLSTIVDIFQSISKRKAYMS